MFMNFKPPGKAEVLPVLTYLLKQYHKEPKNCVHQGQVAAES